MLSIVRILLGASVMFFVFSLGQWVEASFGLNGLLLYISIGMGVTYAYILRLMED